MLARSLFLKSAFQSTFQSLPPITTQSTAYMHTAQVPQWGAPPKYVEAKQPQSIPPGYVRIKVHAAGLHALVRARAAGTHYSSKTLPHTPGTDGVGRTDDGRMVYFSTFATGGSFCDTVDVPEEATTLLPDGIDPLQAAAFINPGLSSWMAMKDRAKALPPDFTVLILGVTSASGTIAVSLARALGAGKVIGCARNLTVMRELDLDELVELKNEPSQTDFSNLTGIDLVLDYVYGKPTEHFFKTVNIAKPLQYVHIGALAGPEINLPGSVLRSKDLTIRGSGPGSFSHEALHAQVPLLLDAFVGMKPHAVQVASLVDVEKVWSEKGDRLVFVM